MANVGVRLGKFIEDNIRALIWRDLRNYQLFTELDMHAVTYHHIRNFLKGRRDWFVRCNLRFRGCQPDIVVFSTYTPKVVIEMGFGLLPGQGRTYSHKAHEIRNKLRNIRRKSPELGKGYSIIVHDGGENYKVADGAEWEKYFYREIFIDASRMHGFGEWKDSWSALKERQQ